MTFTMRYQRFLIYFLNVYISSRLGPLTDVLNIISIIRHHMKASFFLCDCIRPIPAVLLPSSGNLLPNFVTYVCQFQHVRILKQTGHLRSLLYSWKLTCNLTVSIIGETGISSVKLQKFAYNSARIKHLNATPFQLNLKCSPRSPLYFVHGSYQLIEIVNYFGLRLS